MESGKNIEEQQKEIVETLKSKGAAAAGFGDVSALNTGLVREYPVAISILMKYNDDIIERLEVDEHSFYENQVVTRGLMNDWVEIIKEKLTIWGYKNIKLGEFPYKIAATSAGLGWIGKSGLFVSNEFGPRVRLGCVLTNAPFKIAEPVTEDKCGECSLCVKACPAFAIRNFNWKRGVIRDKIINVDLCDEYRKKNTPVKGRKNACGICIKICPLGKSNSA